MQVGSYLTGEPINLGRALLKHPLRTISEDRGLPTEACATPEKSHIHLAAVVLLPVDGQSHQLGVTQRRRDKRTAHTS